MAIVPTEKGKTMTDEWDDYDVCYECTGYGDDYYIDSSGELVCACDDCPYNGRDDWDD